MSERDRVARLTPRQREIVFWHSHGFSNDEIARLLEVSPSTTRTHAQAALVRLHVHSMTGAVGVLLRAAIEELASANGNAVVSSVAKE